jgi:hypothetical protein
MMQLFKLTAEVLRRFDFAMAHDRPWQTFNATFNMQSNVVCTFMLRRPARNVVASGHASAVLIRKEVTPASSANVA